MRTVPTLCASSLGCSLSALGLAVARPENDRTLPIRDFTPDPEDMTAVAAYPVGADLTSAFPLATTPQPRRLASRGGEDGRARSSSARIGQKRSLTPRDTSVGRLDRSLNGEEDLDVPVDTPGSQPRSWRRRLSSTISMSRDSSRPPTSRPGSSAISYSNGSFAFSASGSLTPMFSDNTPPPLLPNKLVKRSTSLRSTNGSLSPLSASKLPLPVFRRPATSHQRKATLQERFTDSQRSSPISHEAGSTGARDVQWRHYFTPRAAGGELSSARKRSSSGIPNPIKRIYPDRRHIPTLISAREIVKPAQLESDDGLSEDEDSTEATKVHLSSSVASSPMVLQPKDFEETTPPRRSFSIGDLLSTGPQPLWRRPSSTRNKLASTKTLRKSRQRVVSAPHTSMGNASSTNTSQGLEPPAKRRDLTDPTTSQRSIYSASSGTYNPESLSQQGSDVNLAAEAPYVPRVPRNKSRTPPSAVSLRTPSQTERFNYTSPSNRAPQFERSSISRSDIPSTVGSESEFRSLGDNSTDYQSDVIWDSFPTRTTRSSSGRRGPHIENIFDDSPPAHSSGRSTKLRDLLNEVSNHEDHARYRHSTIEEEGSVLSTPVRSVRNQSVTSTPSAAPRASQVFSSSPPVMNIMPDPDEIDWDASDDESRRATPGLGIQHQFPAGLSNGYQPERSLPFRFGPVLRAGAAQSANSTPQRGTPSAIDKANLFDWSEQQPSPSHAANSPPRPRTVHGKKDQDSRGSRSTGRRAPSGMHARSHSVPVVPETDGKRNNVIANKFGTWGVGSKAVTEDWNEDFDFDEPTTVAPESMEVEEKRIDSGHEMFVPRSIREQQQNVVAHISLLREWGLLIEELKDLRVRAVALDMLNGPYAQAWREVDAMIELADQESEEHTLQPRKSPPSSPGFDSSAFEEGVPTTTQVDQPPAGTANLGLSPLIEARINARSSPQPTTPTTTRPRKDSELVAQSVIAALQSKRSVSDPTTQPSTGTKKVPFDTATLRHIVPYVNGLKRKVKDALRETEGLYSSPRRRTSPEASKRTRDLEDDSPFRSIFNEPSNEADTDTRRSRRQRAATDNDGSDSPLPDQRGSRTKRMHKKGSFSP